MTNHDDKEAREAFEKLHGHKPKLKPNGTFESVQVAQKWAFFKAGEAFALSTVPTMTEGEIAEIIRQAIKGPELYPQPESFKGQATAAARALAKRFPHLVGVK